MQYLPTKIRITDIDLAKQAKATLLEINPDCPIEEGFTKCNCLGCNFGYQSIRVDYIFQHNKIHKMPVQLFF